MRIPKIIHRIWVGGAMPEALQSYGETWRRHHPNWDHRLWTDDTLSRLRNQDLYDQAERIAPANVGQFRADLARYEILHRYGGVYVDADFEAQRPIDALIANVPAFAAWETNEVWINNAILGAQAGDPLLDRLIEWLPASIASNAGRRPNVMTGPQYLTRLWRTYPNDWHIFPSRLFYPYLWNELARKREAFPDAYAIHHWNNRRSRTR